MGKILLELGVIADDLTGALMVASLLQKEGVYCPLVTSLEALDNLDERAEAVVIGCKLRVASVEEAVAEARSFGNMLLSKGTKRIYYKYSALFMSTDKGNIGPVSECLMKLTGADHVLFCPRWAGCTVYMGRLFVNHLMLHESGASHDPVTPMTNSNLVEVLQAQSKVEVGFVPLSVLHRSVSESRKFLKVKVKGGTSFFIADALDDEQDLARIAELAIDMPFSTGADGLPVYLARLLVKNFSSKESINILPPAPGYAAVLAGSCSGKTNRQLKLFEKNYPLYRVDLLEASRDLKVVEDVIDWAKTRVAVSPIGVATTLDNEGVVRVQKKLGREAAANLAEDILGEVTARLHNLGVRKFIVAGGETSGKVIGTLGIDRLTVAAFDHLGGGYCHAQGADPISLVTKAGGQGEENFFAQAIERLSLADRQVT
ncbi:MAG: four-carbon acid sugar kinase family protein [OM182 bacterium]|uniref:Four-carbon acid sugar kinase family protein n=1 Tax=OM182 bacterium TaxID=2510334 RepID=A0A520RXD5_9GAMM|nr:MAG: four-carbon acid sugar kinase family protein [OM182 bacterium]